ncbi:MAG: hypothetical protein Kow0069_14810 [Promethearchaeota archaeon]
MNGVDDGVGRNQEYGGRRILLCFLGTTDYKEVDYEFRGEITRTRFVQVALARVLCQEWNENDRIVVLTTAQAREKNWVGERGLAAALEELNLPVVAKSVDIEDPNGLEEFWELFHVLMNVLEDRDEVHVDTTHSFRSIPLICAAALIFAEEVKQIELGGIYYGAFFSSEHERPSPVLELTPFVQLARWAIATASFVKHGDPSRVAELTRQEVRAARDLEFDPLRKMAGMLMRLGKDLVLVRGRDLVEAEFLGGLRKAIEGARTNIDGRAPLAPLAPLINKVGQLAGKFDQNRVLNGLTAAEWCHQHELHQQALTFLRETLVSAAQAELGGDLFDEVQREELAAELLKSARGGDEETDEHVRIVEERYPGLSALLRDVAQPRNDVNHGGFRRDPLGWKSLEKIVGKLLDRCRGVLGLAGE